MAIERGNWSFRDPGDDVPDGSVIAGGNFSQLVPGTEILVGKTLTINGGNWTNVAVQPGWTINGGNWAQRSFCSHLHPEFVAAGLTEEDENCPHVIATDTMGGLTVYTYEDTRI